MSASGRWVTTVAGGSSRRGHRPPSSQMYPRVRVASLVQRKPSTVRRRSPEHAPWCVRVVTAQAATHCVPFGRSATGAGAQVRVAASNTGPASLPPRVRCGKANQPEAEGRGIAASHAQYIRYLHVSSECTQPTGTARREDGRTRSAEKFRGWSGQSEPRPSHALWYYPALLCSVCHALHVRRPSSILL